MPCVERPPLTPEIIRQGQIASQLHDSKYEPRIRHGVSTAIAGVPITRGVG